MSEVNISWDETLGQILEGDDHDAEVFGYRKGATPGAAWWLKNVAGQVASLRFICPCGCGQIGHLPVKPGAENGWDWNGDLQLPTTTPSIQKLSPCKWHGYLTAGVFKKC